MLTKKELFFLIIEGIYMLFIEYLKNAVSIPKKTKTTHNSTKKW